MSNTQITLQVKEIKSFFGKSLGMLEKKKPEAIFFTTRFGIHTFGMKFPIDVLVLDNMNRVVKIAEQVKPNKIVLWNPKYNKVIELPEGTIAKKKIQQGNHLNLLIR